MKKNILKLIILITVCCLYSSTSALAIVEHSRYDSLYNSLKMTDYEFIHGEDPNSYYEQLEYVYSPYPLIRTSSILICKNAVVEPGYYLLTPRTLNGRDFILFKQKGMVKAAIPVFEKHMINKEIEFPKPPSPKVSWWKKPFIWIKNGFGKLFGKYRKPPDPPPSKLEAFDLDHIYYEIDLIYDTHKYKIMFKKG